MFEGVEVFQEEPPQSLLGVAEFTGLAEFTGAAGVLAEDVVDVFAGVFEHVMVVGKPSGERRAGKASVKPTASARNARWRHLLEIRPLLAALTYSRAHITSYPPQNSQPQHRPIAQPRVINDHTPMHSLIRSALLLAHAVPSSPVPQRRQFSQPTSPAASRHTPPPGTPSFAPFCSPPRFALRPARAALTRPQLKPPRCFQYLRSEGRFQHRRRSLAPFIEIYPSAIRGGWTLPSKN